MLVHFALLASLAAAPGSSATWRIETRPANAAERALVRCGHAGFDSPDDVSCLVAVSEGYPGTVGSGLARLAAGLRLLDDERAPEALRHLTHPDVEQTGLQDWALLGIGRAQEALEQLDAAARSLLAAAAEPESNVPCVALPRAAEALRAVDRNDEAVAALEEALVRCPAMTPTLLADLAEAHLARGDRRAAAAALDRVDRDYPASTSAREAAPRLRALSRFVPDETDAQKAERRLRKGEAFLGAGRISDALSALRSVDPSALPGDEADRARILLGRAALARGRRSEARSALAKVKPDSPRAAEAAFYFAKEESGRIGSVDPFRTVADTFGATPWAEQALLEAGNYFQKDALDEEALPWYRRLVTDYPSGTHVERAAWRVAWADFRSKRFDDAAQLFERTARLRPPSRWTPAFLYWAGRARLALGQHTRARYLLEETVQRYKHAYHGLRARESLARMGRSKVPPPPALEGEPPPEALPERQLERLRRLLLADRLPEAAAELERLGDSPRVRSTLAWVQWRRGLFLEAIVTMKRAHPEWVSAAGDRLPEDIWRILFPLRYEHELRKQARDKGLDPCLVAAVILQESSYDPAALSRAGARGLMQVMPGTGRSVAHAKGVHYRRAALHNPTTSLDFGTHYLRQLSDRFDGAVEKVLAAYNAGPHRVDAWMALQPGLTAEAFIESIPFTETRQYVMLVLANREQYRRLYRLDRPEPGPVQEVPARELSHR